MKTGLYHILILSLVLLLSSCDKQGTASSYISIDGQEWELDQGHYQLYTRETKETVEQWHTLKLYSTGLEMDSETQVSGNGVYIQMNLHPLSSSDIIGNYIFRKNFVNDGKSASEQYPTIGIINTDSTITYSDLKTGTTCDVTQDGDKYVIEIEGYISEWKEINNTWVEDSIPLSAYYKGELEHEDD